MTYRALMSAVNKHGWRITDQIREKGVLRVQIVTKRGKMRTVTIH